MCGPPRVDVVKQAGFGGFGGLLERRGLACTIWGANFITATLEQRWVSCGQVRLFEDIDVRCTWSWVPAQSHHPKVDFICVMAVINFEESPTTYKLLLCRQWTFYWQWQRDQISPCFKKSIQLETIIRLKRLSANRFLKQFPSSHNGVKSVILLFEWLSLHYERHKVNLHCYQHLKVKFPARRKWL